MISSSLRRSRRVQVPSGAVLHPRRLNHVIATIIVAVSVCLVLEVIGGDWEGVLALAQLDACMIGCRMLVRRGHGTLATALILSALTFSLVYLAYHAQGLRDEAIVGFPAILVFSAMFGSTRLFLSLLGVMLTALAGLFVGNITGWHVNAVPPVSGSTLGVLFAILSATAYFIWLMANDLRRALARLERENSRIRESHARIDVLAHHDALTGLPNRLLARDRIEQALARAQRDESGLALLFLDLDNFKAINDSLGHGAGDLLLCEVAVRLRSAVRASDTISRQGGDEFLVMVADLGDHDAAASIAVKLLQVLTQPFHVNGVELFVTTSLGIALYPQDGGDFSELLKNADTAMYRAKDAGRNAFRFYDGSMNTAVVETLQLISGLRAALSKGEFRLHYQPQYHLRTGRIVGAEALIRWRHPDLGMIPPTKFIPVAERSGLINEVGAWVLREACAQAKRWQQEGLDDLVVAVNLSPIQFRRDDIEGDIASALAAADLPASCIELELTESLLIADSAHLSPLLARLRERGLRFSIDDFGTGYSNLGYLKRFEVERLKIDQSFVHRMTQDPNDEAIVRAIIDMAASLRLETIAEGVEDAATLRRLLELGCEFGQGYLWSPALPPDEFLAFVREQRALAPAGMTGPQGHSVPGALPATLESIPVPGRTLG